MKKKSKSTCTVQPHLQTGQVKSRSQTQAVSMPPTSSHTPCQPPKAGSGFWSSELTPSLRKALSMGSVASSHNKNLREMPIGERFLKASPTYVPPPVGKGQLGKRLAVGMQLVPVGTSSALRAPSQLWQAEVGRNTPHCTAKSCAAPWPRTSDAALPPCSCLTHPVAPYGTAVSSSAPGAEDTLLIV